MVFRLLIAVKLFAIKDQLIRAVYKSETNDLYRNRSVFIPQSIGHEIIDVRKQICFTIY